MTRRNFRPPRPEEIMRGLAIWLDGRHFEDTNPIGPKPRDQTTPVCGPYLIQCTYTQRSHRVGGDIRVELLDPETGRRRSMWSSWLLVPKEE